MINELKQLQHLVDISGAIIETPNLSIKDFGIERDASTKCLHYVLGATTMAMARYATIGAASSTMKGRPVIVSSSILSSIGLIAGIGGLAAAGAAAGGLSATGIGLVAAPFVLAGGYVLYCRKKEEQEKQQQEKDRIYKEIIKKQQAAIKRQKELNYELEKRLRSQDASIGQLKKDIQNLRLQIEHLTEVIELLTEQLKAFNGDIY